MKYIGLPKSAPAISVGSCLHGNQPGSREKSKKIFPGLYSLGIDLSGKIFCALDAGLLPCYVPALAGTPLPPSAPPTPFIFSSVASSRTSVPFVHFLLDICGSLNTKKIKKTKEIPKKLFTPVVGCANIKISFLAATWQSRRRDNPSPLQSACQGFIGCGPGWKSAHLTLVCWFFCPNRARRSRRHNIDTK